MLSHDLDGKKLPNKVLRFLSLQNNSFLDQEQKDLKDKYSQLVETKVSLDREIISLQNMMAEERNAKDRLEMMKADVERMYIYKTHVIIPEYRSMSTN